MMEENIICDPKSNACLTPKEINGLDENIAIEKEPAVKVTNLEYELSRGRRYLIMTLLWMGQFLIFVTICSLAPFFPKEAEAKNATATEYGMIIGSYQLSTLINCPIFVKLVSHHDEKMLEVLGLAACSLATILFGFITHLDSVGFITTAFILRIINGIGAASFQVTSYITVASIFPNNIASGFASLETAVGLGYIVGPAFGGFLYELGGFPLPFVSIGSVMLLVSIVAVFAIPKRKPDGETMSLKAMLKFTLNFSVILSILAIITNEFNTGFLAATLEPYLRQFSLRTLYIGLIFMAEGACYAFTTPIWGYLTDKGVQTVISCLLGCVICFFGCIFVGPLPLFSFEPELWLIILSLILCGLGIAAKMVCAFSGMLQFAEENDFPLDKNTYALTSAIFNAACAVGASAGPLTGGAFLDYFDFRSGTYLLALMELLLGSLYVIDICRTRSRTKRLNHSPSKDNKNMDETVSL